MDININNIIENNPYLKALTIFTKINKISNNFSKIYKYNNKNQELPQEFKSLEKFIDYFIEEKILINEKDNLEKEREKEYIQKYPQKIFTFFLNELHKIFKNNHEENIMIQSVEYDRERALGYFKEFRTRDESIISELFFGTKLITKYCKKCQMTQYICKYLRFIPLYINNINEDFNLKNVYNSLQREFNIRGFCEMCSDERDLKVKIEIKEKPKILIFIIINYQNGINMKFPYTFQERYELICAETLESKNCILSCFNKICKKNNKYYKISYNYSKYLNNYENYLNENNLPKGNPYVLFYERIYDYQENNNINDKMTEIDNNDFKSSQYLNNSNKNFNINNNFNIDEKNNFNNIKEKYGGKNSDESFISEGKEICLYFKFKENEKELFIDIKDNQIFNEIIEQFKNKYKLNDDENNKNKIYYKKKKINCQKTPKQLGLKDGAYLDVY